jgi:selenide,water dikinase
VVIGGHSIIDEELKYGMAITGVIHPDRVIRNVGVQAGDVLVLTKALGTGIITTALKKRNVPRKSLAAALSSMIALNRTASEIMLKFSVHACSDITGYGLLGHALEMAGGGNVTLVLEADKLPILPGAFRLAEEGVLTGGCKRNRDYLKDKISIDPAVSVGHVELALDPQTSGGLLISLPEQFAAQLVDELRAKGVNDAAAVGHATAFQKTSVMLV